MAPDERATPRPTSTVARAERDGYVLCPAVMVVIRGKAGDLGLVARDDISAWFYGDLDPDLEAELEMLAKAAREGRRPPAIAPLDLVLQTPGGELELEGCRLIPPVRHAGPASTLEYGVSHPGAAGEQLALVA